MANAECIDGPKLGLSMQFGSNQSKTAVQSGLTLMPSWNFTGPWSGMHFSPTAMLRVTTAPPKKPAKERSPIAIMAKPGTRAYAAFNESSCSQPDEHPTELHICAYFLAMANQQCAHPKRFCHRKQHVLTKNGGLRVLINSLNPQLDKDRDRIMILDSSPKNHPSQSHQASQPWQWPEGAPNRLTPPPLSLPGSGWQKPSPKHEEVGSPYYLPSCNCGKKPSSKWAPLQVPSMLMYKFSIGFIPHHKASHGTPVPLSLTPAAIAGFKEVPFPPPHSQLQWPRAAGAFKTISGQRIKIT